MVPDAPNLRDLVRLVDEADLSNPTHETLRALQFLGASGDESSLRPLRDVLDSASSEHARNVAAMALGQYGKPPADELLADAAGSARSQLQGIIAESLAAIPTPRSASALTQLLSADDALVRAKAARALGGFPDQGSAQELIAALGDGARLVRVAAAQSLGQRRVVEATPALRALARRERFRPVARRVLTRALTEIRLASSGGDNAAVRE